MNPPARPPRPDDFDPRAFEDDDPFDSYARPTSAEASSERRLGRSRMPLRWRVLTATAITIGIFVFWKEFLGSLIWAGVGMGLWWIIRANSDRWER